MSTVLPSTRDTDLRRRLLSPAWLIAGTLVLAGCAQHRPVSALSPVQPIATSTPPANASQPAFVQQYATLSSKATGHVRLLSIGGDTQQCRATRLFIGLADRSDEPMFERLITTHKVLDLVHIDDLTSGHQVYTMRGVTATGKNTSTFSYPVITLKFAEMTVSGCDARTSALAPVIAPRLRIP